MYHQDFPVFPSDTGLEPTVQRFLSCNGPPGLWNHVAAVAALSGQLADWHGLDRDRCVKSALLHDISGVLSPAELLSFAVEKHWPINAAEQAHPLLLHQHVSGCMAEMLFAVSDPVILSAIECHTTLKANPSPYDMTLFLADKLSRKTDTCPPFYETVQSYLPVSLERACHIYLQSALDSGMLLSPHPLFLEALDFFQSQPNGL